MKLRYGSVCSGIEAASVAWRTLGWQAAWLSEIEPFPSAVLRHHYPDVPNLGNMCVLPLSMALDEIEAPDILVGGTPCQSFSPAGLRSGLLDTRGQLTLKYVELLNEIDAARRRDGLKPCIAVWENVPGVLSSKDNAFGCFLAALAGESEPLPANAKGRWPNAGVVFGPERTIAWRTMDAQYFGLAQRRKRVFLVASARDDFHPGQVFFESNGLRGHSPTSRSKGEEVAQCLTSRTGGPYDLETETILGTDGRGSVTHSLRGEGFDASENGTGRGKPLVVGFQASQSGVHVGTHAGTLDSNYGGRRHNGCVAFNHNAQAAQLPTDARDTSRSDSLTTSQQAAVAYMTARTFGADGGIDEHFAERDVCDAIHTASGSGNKAPMMVSYVPAISIKGAAIGRKPEAGPQYGETVEDIAYTQNCVDVHGVMTPEYRVRRLTPRECERLQGFPDDYTLIPIRGKTAADCPDGPRYKALGNSMAVPCMRWIGERMEKALQDSWTDEDNWL